MPIESKSARMLQEGDVIDMPHGKRHAVLSVNTVQGQIKVVLAGGRKALYKPGEDVLVVVGEPQPKEEAVPAHKNSPNDVQAVPSQQLLLIRELDRKLSAFINESANARYMAADDFDVIHEARRRIHVIRLSIAFAENRGREQADSEKPFCALCGGMGWTDSSAELRTDGRVGDTACIACDGTGVER